jgi:hypothetical protein
MYFPFIESKHTNDVIHCTPKLLNGRKHGSERPHHHLWEVLVAFESWDCTKLGAIILTILSLEDVNSPCPTTTSFLSFLMMSLYAWDSIFALLTNAKLNVYSIFERNKPGSLYELCQQAYWETLNGLIHH